MNARTFNHGIISGLAGGLVFGLMMGVMGTLPMIGKMIGIPTVAAGWVVHLGISATIGLSFGVIGSWLVLGARSGLVIGGLYGAFWWLMGPLTLMPLFMGMGLGVNWNPASALKMMPSLMGHLVFGVIMGVVFAWLRRRSVTTSKRHPRWRACANAVRTSSALRMASATSRQLFASRARSATGWFTSAACRRLSSSRCPI